MIQAKAYLKNVFDIENITVKTFNSIPLKIKDIAEVNITHQIEEGMVDLNGQGDTVGGIVIVRFGENPYAVIKAVKAKLET
jgi:Cu(I)/Ag(I) efflux system membrane protein CusA/SilA